MQAVDHRIVAWMSGLDWPVVTPLMKLASAAGSNGLVFLAIAAALAAWRRRVSVIGWTFLAVACSHFMSSAIKGAIGRARPSAAHHDVHPLIAMPQSSAMPSGHAWTAFAAATVLAAAAPRIRLAVFGLAALIAVSRVYLGVHYPSDVIAGAAGGVATGLVIAAVATRVEARPRRLA